MGEAGATTEASAGAPGREALKGPSPGRLGTRLTVLLTEVDLRVVASRAYSGNLAVRRQAAIVAKRREDKAATIAARKSKRAELAASEARRRLQSSTAWTTQLVKQLWEVLCSLGMPELHAYAIPYVTYNRPIPAATRAVADAVIACAALPAAELDGASRQTGPQALNMVFTWERLARELQLSDDAAVCLRKFTVTLERHLRLRNAELNCDPTGMPSATRAMLMGREGEVRRSRAEVLAAAQHAAQLAASAGRRSVVRMLTRFRTMRQLRTLVSVADCVADC